jgi:exopolysaccharide production protein ExoQ
MPASLALVLWVVLLLALLRFDPARHAEASSALWVPLIWMFFASSRNPSQWIGGQVVSVAQAIEQGDALNRSIELVLIALATAVLISRSFKWSEFFASNRVLIVYLLFALLSVLWSDLPFIAFKRWFHDVGACLMMLVILSDSRPLQATCTVLRRLSYLLIPLSILLIKYYPAIGIHYDDWTGQPTYTGATTSKDLLGAVCLISLLFFFWDIATRWSDRKERRTRRIILVNFAFIGMALWLLHVADCATCRVCLLLGSLVILAAHSRIFRRHPNLLKSLIPSTFLLYLVLVFGLNLNGTLNAAVGRGANLTGRTNIWRVVLSAHTNPLIGCGYESFWLGPRLQWLWQQHGIAGINEAHNGYLEVYLNLGLVGLFLLCSFVILAYSRICKRLELFTDFGSFSAAIWIAFVFRNVTEASFRSGLMWLTFLLGALAVPELSVSLEPELAPSHHEASGWQCRFGGGQRRPGTNSQELLTKFATARWSGGRPQSGRS